MPSVRFVAWWRRSGMVARPVGWIKSGEAIEHDADRVLPRQAVRRAFDVALEANEVDVLLAVGKLARHGRQVEEEEGLARDAEMHRWLTSRSCGRVLRRQPTRYRVP